LVATDDGRVLGVVLVQEAHGQNHPYALRDEACAFGQQLQARLSERGIENADIVLKAEDALLGRAVEQGGQAGEIVLLVVMAAARGMGMGKRLMREGAQWLAERGVAQVRLATDESCDWQVYEHLGMERVAQDTIGDDPSLEIYVYQMPTSALVKRLS
jgi:GNAT superfamily N-acetyltransferase